MSTSGVEVVIESIELTRNLAGTRVLRAIWRRVGQPSGSVVGSYFIAVRPEGPKSEWTQFQVVGPNVEIDLVTITAGIRAEHFEVCVRVKDDRRETPWSAVRSSRNSPPAGPMRQPEAIGHRYRAPASEHGTQALVEDLQARLDKALREIRLLTQQRDHAVNEGVMQRVTLEKVVSELRNDVAAREVTQARVADREVQTRKLGAALEAERVVIEGRKIALAEREEQIQLRLSQHDELMERVSRLVESERLAHKSADQLTRRVAELEAELASRHTSGNPPTPHAAPLQPAPVVPWVKRLIKSNEYMARRTRAGRRAPADHAAESLLLRLSLAGGRVPESALVGEFGEHEAAVRTRITSVKGILNIDGYEVLTLTPDGMVVLDEHLARQQFGVVV